MVIGITGGIGSGKTYVSSIFEKLGFYIYNSDLEAKRLMSENIKLVNSIKELLGDVYTAGKYDPQKAMDDVLGSPEILRSLENLIEPYLKKDFLDFLNKNDRVLLESALLLNPTFSDFSNLCDIKVVITAPIDVRISRIKTRDMRTDQDIERFLKIQMNDDDIIPLCDYQIVNDGRNDIENEVRELIMKLF